MTEIADRSALSVSGITSALSYDQPALIETEDAKRRTPGWVGRYRALLLAADTTAVILALVSGYLLRFGEDPSANAVAYTVISLLLIAGWLITLQAMGGYEIKHLATGPEEAKRVLRASATLAGIIAVTCYATQTDVARGFVVGVIPFGIVLLATGRTVVRRYVQRRRATGAWTTRILAVGTSESVRSLIETTQRAVYAGLQVVGACAEDAEQGSALVEGVPVVGGVRDAARGAHTVGADVVAVTGEGLGPVGVRELGWALEGTGRGLVMAPSLTEVAGTRVHITPVEGLPLVWLEQPKLGRLPKMIKRTVDVVGSLAILLLTAPVLLATAAAVKITSRGPVFFRQVRLGLNGDTFSIVKFRSMCVGAEAQRALILEQNEQDGGGVLFKIKEDPRVTQVGKWIRKFSIDELPQLINVLGGTMSLVGPRPLAAEDSIYQGHARRRLLVKPGMTGLWQISGRSQTTWDDAVRMDLYYVENWSLGFDISILLRTIAAVLARKGAY